MNKLLGAFAHFNNLNEISLAWNNLNSIEALQFGGIGYVRIEINLNRNNISSIDP